MDDFLAQTNSWAQGMQANSQQMLQSTSAGMQQTQTANREWTQQNSDGTIVHCITVGVYTTCK
ncbi:MAG TPA: hypothetical protein VK533_05645 [Sphingomonas sp.]|uniref:hypothetical protein n=1 Tax=Sphingomonas sp. TaxID=28214 RepID=UPI002BC00230|nr:hypothetical protein [Sphingomonas sp.]HMI19009.1 hypothetical protein [Sphingomonas sp.]